jgi:type IV secretion system protein VirB9
MIAWTWALLLSLPAVQAELPPAPSDPRILTITYSTGAVVTLPVSLGYAAVVELSPEEQVESVVVGDSAAWQVTTNRRGDRVVVKPLSAVSTNMIVITDSRRYVFMLEPAGGGMSPLVLHFTYPSDGPVALQASAPVASYRMRGARELYPLAMVDDGKRTTVTWGARTAIPAVFAVDERGRETLVNGLMVDGEYVIDGTAGRYVFRHGKGRATATRKPQEKKK